MYEKLLVVLLVACVYARIPRKYPKGCIYEGEQYSFGEEFPARDGCNICTCTSYEPVSCTEESSVCTYNGKEYMEGESFPAGDKCNRCTCRSNGQVSCTEKYCAPVNVCSQPKPNCQGYFQRWWYNSKTRTCEQFTGCKRNGNNFPSKNACQTECKYHGYGK